MSSRIRRFGMLALIGCPIALIAASVLISYQVNVYTMSTGRQTSTGGGYKLAGTAGQSLTGIATGGGYSLSLGYEAATAPGEDSACPSSTQAVASPALWDAGFGGAPRYLSFTAGDRGRKQAIRVTLPQPMPVPFEAWGGLQMWVGEPTSYCENAGQGTPPPEGCGSAPGLSREFLASTLQCDPHYADWVTLGAVQVYHQVLVPGTEYEIQAIDEACDNASEGGYSAPLVLAMSGWGDVVENCTVVPCPPPDGSVDVTTDVTAILDKFKNSNGALITARADIEPQVPDQKINISDVTFGLDAFRGRSYPPASFPPPSPRPCQ